MDIQPGMCVAVVGLGVSGQAAVRYSLACGGRVLISDSRSEKELRSSAGSLLDHPEVEWEAEGHNFSFLGRADLLILSPGVPHDLPVFAELEASGVPVAGELAVATPHLRVPVVAITGTNGKTTVTSLVAEILRSAGKKVFIGGNIGIPLLDLLCSGEEVDVIVLEVSSFQLRMAGEFAPDVAVLLNITPDHLDRHGSFTEYTAAKKCLFQNQTSKQSAIFFGDDAVCRSLKHNLQAKIRTFGSTGLNDALAGTSGVVVAGETAKQKYNLDGTPLAGPIGALNAAAAILAVEPFGLTPDQINAALKSFQPPPHRLQQVAEHAGVAYVNDSKATNTGAVIAALNQVEGPVILIAGGKHKGEDYSLLVDAFAEKVREVIAIGEAAGQISLALARSMKVRMAVSMNDAVQMAADLARPGETVLLSPACASFDMFDSYGHRGEAFMQAVRDLRSDRYESKKECS